MDLEKYLSLENFESREEKANHAQLLLWIYIHEEHADILYSKVNPHSHEDLNRVLITVEADKLESVEPRLFEHGRIESLIEQGILQEVKILMLNPKQLENLVNIVNYVNQNFTEPSAPYPTLGMTHTVS